MGYVHREVGAVERITSYITSNRLNLFALDVSGQDNPQRVSPDVLMSYYEDSLRLWGDFPGRYFVATQRSEIGPMMVHEAVEHAESGSAGISLVLVAYNDGGIISASKDTFGFQDEAYHWANWRPIDFSKPPKLFVWLDKFKRLFSR